MAHNAFDDECKCANRMEIKYVPQLFKEKAESLQLLEDVWENAEARWEARKPQLFLPVNSKDNYGIALMAYISEAQRAVFLYHLFNEAMEMAGQSSKRLCLWLPVQSFPFLSDKSPAVAEKILWEQLQKRGIQRKAEYFIYIGELNQKPDLAISPWHIHPNLKLLMANMFC